jgi:hypothetical protein
LPYKFSDWLVVQTDAIIKVAQPDDCVMVFNSPILLKSETLTYSGIISVPFIIIGKSGGKVRGYETKSRIRIFEADSTSTLVTCHPR